MNKLALEPSPLAVNQQSAARLLGVSVATVRRWEQQGRGPPVLRMSKLVRYRLTDLEHFLSSLRDNQ